MRLFRVLGRGFAQFSLQSSSADTEEGGRFCFVSIRLAQGSLDSFCFQGMQIEFGGRSKTLFLATLVILRKGAGLRRLQHKGRQMAGFDFFRIRHDDPVLHSGAQFAHVAWPRVLTEALQGVIGQGLDWADCSRRKTLGERHWRAESRPQGARAGAASRF